MPDHQITLTLRQEAVLVAIEDTVRRRGYPPTIREIGDAVGLNSTSSVHRQLKTLERLGYLRRTSPGSGRAIELIHQPAAITAETAAHVLHCHGGSGGQAPGLFFEALIEAIARAGETERDALAEAFPGYVAAVRLIESADGGAEKLAELAGMPLPMLAACTEVA